jgi:hypothetical protein
VTQTLPEHPSFDLAAYNQIANMVGGDLYEFVPLPDGRLALLFGDASGHGMTAGLVMAVAHAGFRTQLGIDASPSAMVEALNRILSATGSTRSFFSCAYVLFESDGRFAITVSGHPPVLQIDGAGTIVRRFGTGPIRESAESSSRRLPKACSRGGTLLLYPTGSTRLATRPTLLSEREIERTCAFWRVPLPTILSTTFAAAQRLSSQAVRAGGRRLDCGSEEKVDRLIPDRPSRRNGRPRRTSLARFGLVQELPEIPLGQLSCASAAGSVA